MNSAMIKRVQQMKRDMERTQEEIINTEFKTSCGPVTVIMMGDRNLKQVLFIYLLAVLQACGMLIS